MAVDGGGSTATQVRVHEREEIVLSPAASLVSSPTLDTAILQGSKDDLFLQSFRENDSVCVIPDSALPLNHENRAKENSDSIYVISGSPLNNQDMMKEMEPNSLDISDSSGVELICSTGGTRIVHSSGIEMSSESDSDYMGLCESSEGSGYDSDFVSYHKYHQFRKRKRREKLGDSSSSPSNSPKEKKKKKNSSQSGFLAANETLLASRIRTPDSTRKQRRRRSFLEKARSLRRVRRKRLWRKNKKLRRKESETGSRIMAAGKNVQDQDVTKTPAGRAARFVDA